MKRAYWILISLVVFILIIVIVLSFDWVAKIFQKSEVNATSATAVLSSQADWQGGTLTNIDTATSVGSMQINVKTPTEQSLVGATASGSNVIGNPSDVLNAGCAASGSLGFGGAETPGNKILTIDLGEQKTTVFYELNFANFGAETHFYYSENASDWTEFVISQTSGSSCAGPVVQSPVFSGRYVKILSPADINPSCNWGSFKLFQRAAKHVATVDGTANFWDWETFTPTQTVPANTSVAYRYRSSADGANWNSWHSSFADVESTSGPTRYRYLQVEATLSNTDGASTPTIDAYDITYHTNTKPNKPTASSATVQ